MCESCAMTSLGLISDAVPCGTHVCIVYSTDRERDEGLLKFVYSGIRAGERTACFSGSVADDTLSGFLSPYGISYEELRQKKLLSLANTSEAYFQSGEFDPDRMINLLASFYHETLELGFPAARVIGEMTPEIQNTPGGERLLEYESKVNILLRTHPVTAVCQYDARNFDGATIMDVLKVHPRMIVDGVLINNPFYIEPEIYLNIQ